MPVRKGHLLALAATLIWGSAFIAMRVALDHATAPALVWMRNLIGACFLFTLLAARRMRMAPDPGDRRTILLMGIIFGVHLWLQAVALGTTSTMRAGWIIAFIPAVVAIGAWRFKGRMLGPVGWAGIAVASTGVMLLTAMRPADLVRAGTGDLLMLVSTITWAAYTLLGMGPLQRNGPLLVTAWVLLVSIVPNLVLGIDGVIWTTPPDAGAVGALLFLGIAGSGMALWLFAGAINSLGPERASAFQYVQPFVTMAAAWAVLGEVATTALLVAGPLVLVGVWLVQRGGKAARGGAQRR